MVGVVRFCLSIGWKHGYLGPGSPRLVCFFCIGHLALDFGTWLILGRFLKHSWQSGGPCQPAGIIIAAFGVLTIGGCISRLRRAPRSFGPALLSSKWLGRFKT